MERCDNLELEEVEKDPTGRYTRYSEILGEGAFKIVYRAFDEDNGIEVAWNKVELSPDILKSNKLLQRLYAEADLLKSLKHENVLRCYHSWVDNDNKTINMITELFTSGNLRQYRKKHNGLGFDNNKAIKNWARQILKGLAYLHSHDPPIIHRDLKCENLFVNGNSGKVKIGDLGLATVLEHATACSFTGTPEFMAPELYEEEYNQLVDVYSFGMCMLQMITCEKPYSECSNSAQVYKKVTSGIKPAVLSKVTDSQVRHFIEKCLAPVSERLSATQLLEDPFLASMTSDLSIPRCCPSLTESICSWKSLPTDVEAKKKVTVSEKNIFKLQGEMEEGNDSIMMTLWIMDLGDHAEQADFMFSLETDTSVSVAEEMEKDLGLSSKNASLIAELIEEVIAELVPASYYYKSCLAEARSSSQISSSLSDQDYKSIQPLKLVASEVEIPNKHDPGSQSEYGDLSRKEVSNGSVCHDHPRGVALATQNQDQKQKQDENLDKIIRGGKGDCRTEVVCKARSNFLKKLFVHCKS